VEEQTITPVLNEMGQIQHFIAIKQDISQRKQAEEELERRNLALQTLSNQEREQRQLAEALAKAALVLNRSLKLDEVLAQILEQVKEVIPYQLADITLLEGQTFYDASHRGNMNWPVNLSGAENRFRLKDFPLFKQMVETTQPLLIPDTNLEPNWVMVNGLEWSRSFLSVPLLVEKQVIGFVNLFARQVGGFCCTGNSCHSKCLAVRASPLEQ
jgi:transcriptional regulator with GAF, ATPase, and Fis domain